MPGGRAGLIALWPPTSERPSTASTRPSSPAGRWATRSTAPLRPTGATPASTLGAGTAGPAPEAAGGAAKPSAARVAAAASTGRRRRPAGTVPSLPRPRGREGADVVHMVGHAGGRGKSASWAHGHRPPAPRPADRDDPRGVRRVPLDRAHLPGRHRGRERPPPRQPAVVRLGRAGDVALLAQPQPPARRPPRQPRGLRRRRRGDRLRGAPRRGAGRDGRGRRRGAPHRRARRRARGAGAADGREVPRWWGAAPRPATRLAAAGPGPRGEL